MKKKKKSVHFSSEKQDWATPKVFFDKCNNEFNFKYDLACTSKDCLCPSGLMIDNGIDSLKEDWSKLLGMNWGWLNPPYGRELKKWVKKAHEEMQKGANIVMLIPARPDTSYWHNYILNQEDVEVRFIRGRLKFGDAKNSAPFPSALVIFRGHIKFWNKLIEQEDVPLEFEETFVKNSKDILA